MHAPITPTAIYALRVRLNLSQAELARELGVDSITVSRWERGLRQPSPMARRGLAALLAICSPSPAPNPDAALNVGG